LTQCQADRTLIEHGEKLADISDEYLADVLPIAKKIAIAQGVKDYNILQNNGRLAHQVFDILLPNLSSFLYPGQCGRKLTMSISMLFRSPMRLKGLMSDGPARNSKKRSCRRFLRK